MWGAPADSRHACGVVRMLSNAPFVFILLILLLINILVLPCCPHPTTPSMDTAARASNPCLHVQPLTRPPPPPHNRPVLHIGSFAAQPGRHRREARPAPARSPAGTGAKPGQHRREARPAPALLIAACSPRIAGRLSFPTSVSLYPCSPCPHGSDCGPSLTGGPGPGGRPPSSRAATPPAAAAETAAAQPRAPVLQQVGRRVSILTRREPRRQAPAQRGGPRGPWRLGAPQGRYARYGLGPSFPFRAVLIGK